MQTRVHVILVAIIVVGLPVAGTVAPVAWAADENETGVTFVESDVTTNTTWSADTGPYRVIQDVRVERGATLTIAGGTEVQFADGMSVTVAGSMEANGTEGNPVTLRTTPGAAPSAQWAGLRYDGGRASTLTLANTTIRDAKHGLAVASGAGRVSLRDVTVRETSSHGIAVGDVATMPTTTIERSTFDGIAGHGIAATPASGSLDAISLDAADTDRGESTRHTLTLVPGVETAFDEIVLAYGSHGNASAIDESALRQFGIDTDDEADIDRSLTDRIENVTADGGHLRITLSEPVRLLGDEELVLSVADVVNPETHGIYRVDVRLIDRGVPQLSDGVHAPLVIGGVTTEHADTSVVEETGVESLTVRNTMFRGIDGTGLFVDADSVVVNVQANRMESVAGDGVGVRATTLSGTLQSNRITSGDAGIHLAVRDDIWRLDVVSNTVTGSDAGLRMRQSGSRVRANVGTTIEENTFADNRGHGIDAKAAQGRLTEFTLSNNVLRGNGGTGASLSYYAIGSGAIATNRVVGNGADGIAIRTRSVTGTNFEANTLANNGNDGLDLRAYTSVRDVAIRNATVADNDGHGLALATDLVVHDVAIDDSVLANNAGAGLVVTSPLTHGGVFDVTDTVVAANAYGIHLQGALRANVTGNEIVYNTNERVDPVPIAGVEPGTGISVVEGPHGAIVERGIAEVPLSELVANPRIQAQLADTAPGPETAIVLRTDGNGHARLQAESALPIERALRDLPTGIALPTDATDPGIAMRGNDVTGHAIGLAVDLEPLIDANTTARLLVDGMRTVAAEDSYWNSSSGPFHDSILPGGEGDTVETHAGWVDFVPFATTAHGEKHARPVARISAPDTAEPGSTVTVSAELAFAPNSSIDSYHFVIDDDQRPDRTEPTQSFTMPNETVTIELAVENELGIDSETAAHVTIEPTTPESTTTTATATGEPPTTTPPANERGLAGTVFGLIGAGFYLAGVMLGSYGMWLTLKKRNPPFEGRTVHALALGGVGIWAIGGLLVGSGLLTAAIGGGGLWAVSTGIAYLLATR